MKNQTFISIAKNPAETRIETDASWKSYVIVTSEL